MWQACAEVLYICGCTSELLYIALPGLPRYSCNALSTCVNKDNKNHLWNPHISEVQISLHRLIFSWLDFRCPVVTFTLGNIFFKMTDLCRQFLSSGIYLVLNKCHLESVMTGCRMFGSNVNVEDSRLSLPRSQMKDKTQPSSFMKLFANSY